MHAKGHKITENYASLLKGLRQSQSAHTDHEIEDEDEARQVAITSSI